MRVNEVRGEKGNPLSFPVAIVEEDSLRKEVRLDIVDRWPEVGDYLIVHAGYAIHTLEAEEAKTNLKLMREMAEHVTGKDI